MNSGKITPSPCVEFKQKSALIKIITIIKKYESKMMTLLEASIKSLPNSQLIHAGGCGYKVLSVIDGEADAYIYPSAGLMKWDTCATEAILRSLNGSLTDVFNNEYVYFHKEKTMVEEPYGVIASLSPSNSFYERILGDELKELVQDQAKSFAI